MRLLPTFLPIFGTTSGAFAYAETAPKNTLDAVRSIGQNGVKTALTEPDRIFPDLSLLCFLSQKLANGNPCPCLPVIIPRRKS